MEGSTPEVLTLARAYRAALAAWEPARHSGEDCAEIVEEIARTENASSAARARGATRVAECSAHRARGFADAHDWLASASGSSARDARSSIDVARAATTSPDTTAAWTSGEISAAQAGEIVRAVRDVPECEGELLDAARAGSLGAVRGLARTRRLEAIDREELHTRQLAARAFSHWVDDLGMVCGTFRLPPVPGTAIVNRIQREADRLWRAARKRGEVERPEAHAADALVALLRPRPAPAGKRAPSLSADVVIVQSAEVARRGHAHPGELCHIVGGGPVAPAVVEELIAEGAFVKAVVHDGEQVTHVAHYGRHLTAAMRTARGIGPPPAFDGRVCSEPGCERRLGLETDHVVPVAAGGPTSGENLHDRCAPHHWEKTERDRKAGLLGRSPP